MPWIVPFRERELAVPFPGRLYAQFGARPNASMQLENPSTYPAVDPEVCGQPIGRRLAAGEGRLLFRCRS